MIHDMTKGGTPFLQRFVVVLTSGAIYLVTIKARSEDGEATARAIAEEEGDSKVWGALAPVPLAIGPDVVPLCELLRGPDGGEEESGGPEVRIYTAPDHWAPGFINDDWEGYTPEDEKAARDWAATLPGPIVGTEEEDGGFMRWHDAAQFALAANCARYIVHVEEEEEDGPDLTRAELFADSNRGQYIPQFFAEAVKRELVQGVSAEDWAELEAGPDSEFYWETWDKVLNNATLKHSGLGLCYLYQDGDLWVVPQEGPRPD